MPRPRRGKGWLCCRWDLLAIVDSVLGSHEAVVVGDSSDRIDILDAVSDEKEGGEYARKHGADCRRSLQERLLATRKQ